MSNPFIVIGSSNAERVPAIVLKHTILQHCPSADIIMTHDRPDAPTRGLVDEGGMDPTNFSFVRFWLPELAERKGRALYFDCDMIVFDSVQSLFDTDMGDNWVMTTPNPSVLLVDCERTPWPPVQQMMKNVTDGGTQAYGINMGTLGGIPKTRVGQLPACWNSLDRFVEEETKLLHYTNMTMQPWVNHKHTDSVPAHSLAHLWYDALADAVHAGEVGTNDLHHSMLGLLEEAFRFQVKQDATPATVETARGYIE
jgi:hypothetical protein